MLLTFSLFVLFYTMENRMFFRLHLQIGEAVFQPPLIDLARVGAMCLGYEICLSTENFFFIVPDMSFL